MSLFNLDREKCISCGQCVEICASNLLVLKDSEYPVMREGMEGRCLKCGHCEAICSGGAIDIRYEGAGAVPDVSGVKEGVTYDQFAKLAFSRRSTRNFKSKAIEREKLEKLFDIARYAPTGVNIQSVSWIVINDREKVEKVVDAVIEWARYVAKNPPNEMIKGLCEHLIAAREAGKDPESSGKLPGAEGQCFDSAPICRTAPCLIVAYDSAENTFAQINSVIALTQMDLAAQTLGLGTCWGGFVQMAASSSPQIAKLIGIPEGFAPQYALMAGYPNIEFKRIPKRNTARVIWK